MSLRDTLLWHNTCVNENYIFLDYLLSDHGRVVTINRYCVSQRWFHSPDGEHHTILNGSSSKYTIATNRLQINFGNISASDEGIYGCLDDTNDRSYRYICLKVYGKSC